MKMNANDNSVLVEEIISLVVKHTWNPPKILTVSTRIGEDLRIIGDDADELITEFINTFDVDISEFNFSEYFPGESSAEMHYYLLVIAEPRYQNKVVNFFRYLESIFWGIFSNKKEYKTLTIGDLAFIAKSGKWQ